MNPFPASVPRHSALAVLALTGVVALAACGGSTTATPAPSTPSSSSAATTSTPSDSTASSAPTADSPSNGSAAPAQTDAAVPVESNPPGDIPDNLAFVPYTNAAGGYSFTHPEGWAQTENATSVMFTDKLNGVNASVTTAAAAPTVASARKDVVPQLQSSIPAFELVGVTAATVPAGQGVHIVFRRNSDPDQVTGKVYRDEVEEYLVFKAGKLVALDLFGPVGADNVDAYRTMSQSLSIT